MTPMSASRLAAVERHCGPPQVLRSSQDAGRRPYAEHSEINDDGDIHLSEEARHIARIIGVEDLARRLAVLRRKSRQSEAALVHFLDVRQQISDRVMMAMLDVSRSAAEADCEEERADQLADRLQEVRDQKIRYRTLFALVGDAAVGILSGALGLAVQETAAEASAIFGGTLATAFGLAALTPGGEHEFYHPRNILKEVWEAPAQPALLPPSVWQFLVQRRGEEGSLRDILLDRWRQDGRLGESGSKTEERRLRLFFGEGGQYEIDDLRARAAMLDLLEADVNLMNQHLQVFMQEIMLLQAR